MTQLTASPERSTLGARCPATAVASGSSGKPCFLAAAMVPGTSSESKNLLAPQKTPTAWFPAAAASSRSRCRPASTLTGACPGAALSRSDLTAMSQARMGGLSSAMTSL